MERIKVIKKKHIADKQKENGRNKIQKIANSITRNVNNRWKIWVVKRRATKRMPLKNKLKTQKNKYYRIVKKS